MEREAAKLGLQLSVAKSEVIGRDSSTLDNFLAAAPGFHVTSPDHATLLGSPIGSSIDDCISKKITSLRILEDWVQFFRAHDALLLLRNSLAIPSLMYLLRTASCFLSTQLAVFDEVVKRILSRVFNISFTVDENSWIQASLPIRFGGLGVGSAVH